MLESNQEMESYLDFDLEIGPGQGRDYPLAARSEAGEARGSLHFPYDTLALESRLKDLRIALLRSGGQTRLWLTPEEQAVHDFGRDLFNALLAGKVLGLYRASLARAAGQNQGLRLRLNIRSPELAALPWEFLYDEDQSEYVCLCAQTPLVRYLEAPLEVKPLEAPPPLRILGMVAAPSDLPPLDVHTEKQRLERALADLRRRGLVEVTWLEGDQASWRALQRALRTAAWHVFHFIGHGGFDRAAGEGVLHLVGGDGAHAPLRASQLARLLADNLTLRLALLNACQGASASAHDLFSSTAATLARRGLPAVLAMQYAITDLAAIELAQSFYEALADGLPVDAAAAEARKAVSLAVANSLEWGAPVLYLRAREAILFRLQPPVVAAAPQAGSAPSPATETLIEQEAGKVETGGFAIGQIKAESSDGESAMKAQERIEGLTESAILGRIYTGKVVRITDFGAFVEILPNIGGMVHISELDTQRVKKVEDVVRMGDAITVMVTDIDEQGKIRLSRAAVLKGWTPQAAAPSPAEIVLTLAPSVTMTLLRVPAGEFLMGSNEKKDEQAYDNELPQHRVYLDEYWIAKTPVTNTQYQAFVRATNHRVPSHWQKGAIPKGKEGHPVVYISWDDAADFCNWASRATGHRIELPSEAQWEKAARGADGRIYPWGDQSPDASRCNFDQKVGDTTPVGRYSPLGDSPYGCVDMAGNVWEWCADWYDSGEYARRAKGSPRNPAGPSSGEYHVVRGGSWYRGSRDVRAALRGWRAPSHRGDYLGLRCARSP